MKYIFSNYFSDDLVEKVEAIEQSSSIRPFADIVIEFCVALSKTLLLDVKLRDHRALIAAAHWMRKSNLMKLKEKYLRFSADSHVTPRGMVLHFAPSNVDTVFIYSWLLSVLMGNKNIVRVSQKKSVLVDVFSLRLKRVLLQPKFGEIASINLILSYPHDDLITQILSEKCDSRVIWGGDETIRRIRKIPLSTRATEVVFANRFSLAAIKADAISSLNDNELVEVVEKLIKDSMVYDQNACSSPRTIFFIGKEADIKQSSDRFIGVLSKLMPRGKHVASDTSMAAVARLANASIGAAAQVIDSVRGKVSDYPLCISVENLSQTARDKHQGLGMFYIVECSRLTDIAKQLNQKDQTLCVYGFTESEIGELMDILPPGVIDRVVPFGNALDFSHIWDGYNLLREFSKERYVTC